ncbi:TPA: hypothetical protein JD045_10805 [Citrobacter amalonaticus]|nr:hypothetical protein AL479_23355 [Citrobacter amalonaticus]HAU5065989.1 hypothetical protein [Citrobacter amalonaticus]
MNAPAALLTIPGYGIDSGVIVKSQRRANMLQRHDLLHISVQAAQRIFSRWRTSRVAWQQAFAAGELPGIARRPVEGEPQGDIALGFSFPERINGQRQRLASTITPDEVVYLLTPFEVAHGTNPTAVDIFCPHGGACLLFCLWGRDYSLSVWAISSCTCLRCSGVNTLLRSK